MKSSIVSRCLKGFCRPAESRMPHIMPYVSAYCSCWRLITLPAGGLKLLSTLLYRVWPSVVLPRRMRLSRIDRFALVLARSSALDAGAASGESAFSTAVFMSSAADVEAEAEVALAVIRELLVPIPSLSRKVGEAGRLLCDDGALGLRRSGDGGATLADSSSGAATLTRSTSSRPTGAATCTGMASAGVRSVARSASAQSPRRGFVNGAGRESQPSGGPRTRPHVNGSRLPLPFSAPRRAICAVVEPSRRRSSQRRTRRAFLGWREDQNGINPRPSESLNRARDGSDGVHRQSSQIRLGTTAGGSKKRPCPVVTS